jgi:hypothetical protein
MSKRAFLVGLTIALAPGAATAWALMPPEPPAMVAGLGPAPTRFEQDPPDPPPYKPSEGPTVKAFLWFDGPCLGDPEGAACKASMGNR